MLWQWPKRGNQVFIVDIDGTLMPSAAVDNACYWQAVFNCYGERESLPDLLGFRNITDTGILEEWCKFELGRLPSCRETDQIRRNFLQLLKTAAIAQPKVFRPLAGVIDWLDAASSNERVHVGIATGGWRHSAQLKLKLSGLDRYNLPIASSDDDKTRTGIMQVAVKKTAGSLQGPDTSFAYIGDGIWDLKASQALGWPFIGIASGSEATKLKSLGATLVRPDFNHW